MIPVYLAWSKLIWLNAPQRVWLMMMTILTNLAQIKKPQGQRNAVAVISSIRK